MILHYFKMALHQLYRVKWQALVSVLGMGAGLILFAVCNSFLRSELAANREFATYDRLVCPTYYRDGKPLGNQIIFKGEGVWDKLVESPMVDGVVFSRGWAACLVSASDGVELNARLVCYEGEFSKVFPMELVEGTMAPFDDDNKSIIISKAFAERIFGTSTNVIGKEINVVRVEGTDIGEPLRVVAVVKDYRKSTGSALGEFDFILNAKSSSAKPLTNTNPYYRIYLTMRSMDELEALNNISEKERWSEYDMSNSMRRVEDSPLCFNHISDFNRTEIKVFLVVSIAGFAILLVSIVYILNLFIGLFMLRAKELKLRNFLGAGYISNSLLLFAELLVVTLCSLIVSTIFCDILYKVVDVDAYLVLSKVQIIQHLLHYSLLLLALFMVVSVISVFMVNKVRNSKHRVKNVTLAVQFFITLLFLATSLIFNSVLADRINSVAPYISETQMKQILVMRAPAPYEKFSMFKSDIESMPQYSVAWRDTRYGMFEERLLSKYLVNVDYLKMLNLPGSENLNEGDKFCYITKDMESAVDENGNIMLDNEVFTVTHVIGGNSPRESVVYLPSNGWEPNRCELFIKINDEYSFKDGYERVCEQINKYYAMNNSMIATFYLQTVGGDVPVFMTISFCAMVISLLITVSGIVGTITLDTDRRKKEVAIRKINGAGFKQIYWLFAKLYFRIYVIVALLVTFIIFYVINLQLLGEFISVSLLEWIAVYLFAALVIFISICSKIYQVARINPSELLRAE